MLNLETKTIETNTRMFDERIKLPSKKHHITSGFKGINYDL
ncbi:MAG TPA: hypothetical protein VMW72_21595 [Sedimentisphaerales bacterium]|nr:hypothetical protein [Sedimentisphaerales bacterium]